ncbi:MAG: nitroreductase family protein [Oscillospiraceae bacterium]|nr:nitroreductase family protein [Oscillospiraceae bacterium]
MELYEAIAGRRTVRRFTGDEVPREKLVKLIDSATKVPSWKNTRTPRFTVVTDKAVIARLSEKGAFGMAHNSGIIGGAAAVIVQSAVKGRAGFEPDGTPSTRCGDGYTFFDGGLAAQNISLAAYAEGLGTVIMGIIDYDAIADIVSLPEDEEILCLIAVGVPDGTPSAPPKYTVDEIARFV